MFVFDYLSVSFTDLSFAQALGFVSFALGVVAFCQKDDRKLKIIMLMLNFNHMVHFYLLGSIVSALSSMLSVTRTASAIFTSSKWVALFFVVTGSAFGALYAHSFKDLWPIFGMIGGTISIFLLKGIVMRIGLLFSSICWLINNIIISSIGGTLLETTVISINIFTMLRLYYDNLKRAAQLKELERICKEE